MRIGAWRNQRHKVNHAGCCPRIHAGSMISSFFAGFFSADTSSL